MKKFNVTLSEEQRSTLQSILCTTVMDAKSHAVSLAEQGRSNTDKCMDLLELAANADAIWTEVNLADSVEVDDE